MAISAGTRLPRPAFTISRRKVFGLITHLVLLAIGAIYIFPFLWMLGSSLKTPAGFFDDGLNILPSSDLHFENYTTAWTTANFGTYFGNTIFITFMTVFVTVMITSMAGYVLARTQIVGKRLIIGTILILMFIPSGYTVLPIFEIIYGCT